jgi:hypothetical protein
LEKPEVLLKEPAFLPVFFAGKQKNSCFTYFLATNPDSNLQQYIVILNNKEITGNYIFPIIKRNGKKHQFF